ncbi:MULTISPECIES: LacI family DNA-binding transcriptional regulator [Cohnella]|uniref:LacI family DNA-binding transcriptional regulator n=1 Tax=Cohnella TaxID=329857 RepID=UPI000E36AEAF|nr:LacI family DNA-binding transcriptional regulator [Cohnella sp.]REK67134.1 MAG: LacI family transcriptional regulator [Cohnella sp.]
MATLKDVARKAGVALSTASYALNNRSEVSEETRNKILKAAEELNYKPNGTARDLKQARTKTIGLILSDLSGPFYSELIRSIQEVSYASGYNMIACSSYGGENSTARKFLEERRTDGIILLANNIDNDFIKRTAGKQFPIVVLDREISAPHVWSATVDNTKGACQAVEYLIGLGYGEIGYLSGPVASPDNEKRFEGYQKALQEHGLAFRQQWVYQGYFTKQGGYEAAQAMLAQKQLPRAIFSANDEMAIGAMEAFMEAGLRIPEDIAVIGFDDIELARYIRPGLTTVRQPNRQLGNIATHMLLRALNGDTDIENVRLETELIVRESCEPR